MRKNAFFRKLFLEFVSLFLVIGFCSVYADTETTEVSDSLKDDVSAMITNARRIPHQIFIIDSSENMNTFAYSGAIESCEDMYHNVELSRRICENSVRQCYLIMEVQGGCLIADAGICNEISNHCQELHNKENDMQEACEDVKRRMPEPGMFETLDTVDDQRAKQYVGPWDPTKKNYSQDLCFYDWASDANSDVVDSEVTRSDDNPENDNNLPSDKYNKYKYCTNPNHPYDVNSPECEEEFKNFVKDSGGYLAERSDWDCLTDGSGKLLYGNGEKNLSQTGGVSGLWLNWKYATSLDAIKIILADTHEFAYQPRYRGDNLCYETKYLPYKIYNETAVDSSGNPYYINKKACFIPFDPSLSDVPATEREDQLKSLKAAVQSMWTKDENNITEVETDCTKFDVKKDFAMYDSSNYEDHTREIANNECDKCFKWTGSGDTGSFTETNCKLYDGTPVTGGSAQNQKLDTVSGTFSKECCKTFQCKNPKCRDNDLCCFDNESVFPDESVEGYSVCRPSGEGGTVGDYSCSLGFYSEYDQDADHCCEGLACAEFGDKENYEYGGESCTRCKTGSVVGEDVLERTTEVVNIIETAVGYASCGEGSTEDVCNPIPVTVGIRESDLSSISFGSEIVNIEVKVYYGCIFDDEDHSVYSSSFSLLGTGSCSTADDCLDLVSGSLSGCDKKGYRMNAQVKVTRNSCKYDALNINFDLEYSFETGYENGRFVPRDIFNTNFEDTDPIFHTYNLQTASTNEKIYEYECKLAIYNRELVRKKGKCPSAAEAPAYLNALPEYAGRDKIDYCESTGARQDKLGLCSNTYECSWLCRTAVSYYDPGQCSEFFRLINKDRYGNVKNWNVENNCSVESMKTKDGIENCCSAVNSATSLQGRSHEVVDEVEVTGGTKYKCSVSMEESAVIQGEGNISSKIMSGLADLLNLGDSSASLSGVQAEIVNGHIKEGSGPGYFNLSPYYTESGTLWSPYAPAGSGAGMGGWYSKYSLVHSSNGSDYLSSTLTTLFTTNDYVSDRKYICLLDYFDSCKHLTPSFFANGGIFGQTLAVDFIDQCNYPTFWMKIPNTEGGRLLMSAKEMSRNDYVEDFRLKIKTLKGAGGSTLGETLYDVWRYLGGMYALYDEAHKYKEDSSGNPLSTAYKSPFAANDPQCFSNEAILISGGSPQYDDNSKLKDLGVTCDKYELFNGADSGDKHGAKPCIQMPEGSDGKKEWKISSLQDVAMFVNRNTFWSDPNVEGHENCNPAKVENNAAGFAGSCGGNNPELEIDKSLPLIDRVHAIAVGEWGLNGMYNMLDSKPAGVSSDDNFMNVSTLQNAATQTERDGESGKYYTLVSTNDSAGSLVSGGGSFSDLTSLFQNFMKKSDVASVVVGRPHWTSSLVQPFDVEEKYRGPEAYVAGTVPVSGSVSRFWFGNIKKYDVSGGTECPITNDSTADCGEWKRQTFDAKDCFGSEDNANNGFSDDENTEQFKKLMVGGAAYKLKNKLEGASCGDLPCFRTSPRTIYYDLGVGTAQNLKDANLAMLTAKLQSESGDASIGVDTAQQIFDYMAGYDSFKESEDARKKVRFSPGTGEEDFEVDDPFVVDFSGATKITLRRLLLGAIVHSKPIAIYYGDLSNKKTRVYVGANDGMLHAFDASGEEVYAYIPSLAFKSIANFAYESSNIFFNASVDGPISMLHIDQSHDGAINYGEKAYLIIGYRRGARGYTVIDISDPDKPEFVQNINTDGGMSFGKAVVFRKCSGSCSYANDLDYYLAVPGGYDDCHDPSALTTNSADNKPTCKLSQLLGNKFMVYKFDKSEGKFVKSLSFTTTTGLWSEDAEKDWLVTSFASTPLAINTVGKAAINTEFIYFTDLSGTVFRLDVRDDSISNWKASVVFTERTEKSLDKLWGQIGRSYVASNLFPPLERYNPSRSDSGSQDWLIPIPVITGNAVNPRYLKQEGIFVFYDKKDGKNTPLYTDNFLINVTGESHKPKNGMLEGMRGWQVNFNATNGEKGITEPLIVYDIYGDSSSDTAESMSTSNSYSIAWNTFIPMKSTECKTFGTSSNYERFIPDGAQAFKDNSLLGANGEWSVSNDASGNCIDSDSPNISLATGVGIVATDTGYDLTFGAGADIFRKEKLSVKRNKTYIIKWYELY